MKQDESNLSTQEFFFAYYSLLADSLRVWFDTRIKLLLSKQNDYNAKELLSIYVQDLKRQLFGEIEGRRCEDYREMLGGMKVKLMSCL